MIFFAKMLIIVKNRPEFLVSIRKTRLLRIDYMAVFNTFLNNFE